MSLFPPGTRVTAYRYALDHGLPTDLAALADLGLAAARHARWLGIPEFRVPEGPCIVHTWPAAVYEYVITWQAQADAEAWGGQPPSASYQAWREEGRIPSCSRCDTGDHRCPGCGRLLPHGTELCLPCDESLESLEVIPPWCPLPRGDQALRDIGY